MTTVVAITFFSPVHRVRENASCNESERANGRLIQLLGHNARFNRSFLALVARVEEGQEWLIRFLERRIGDRRSGSRCR
jgi:hypothetical protein